MVAVAANACNSKSDQGVAGGGPPGGGLPGAGGPGSPAQVLDYEVMTIRPRPAELHTDYPTVLQGQADVEIWPKVEGLIDQVLPVSARSKSARLTAKAVR